MSSCNAVIDHVYVADSLSYIGIVHTLHTYILDELLRLNQSRKLTSVGEKVRETVASVIESVVQ